MGAALNDLKPMQDGVFVTGVADGSSPHCTIRTYRLDRLFLALTQPLFCHPVLSDAFDRENPAAYSDWSNGASGREEVIRQSFPQFRLRRLPRCCIAGWRNRNCHAIQENGRSEGHAVPTAFERCGERAFGGFIVDPGDPARRFVVDVLVDGHSVRTLRADSFVHGLVGAYAGDGCHGFQLTLPPDVLTGCSVIEARLANIGTSVGGPIEIAEAITMAGRIDGPGALCWLGGLRFSGWIATGQDEAGLNVLVDQEPVTTVWARGWTHVGTVAYEAYAVRTFDFHLPDRYADGKVRQLEVVSAKGERLSGSPLAFVAFINGLERAIAQMKDFDSELPRAALFDRLMPMSFPMSRYQEWKAEIAAPPVPSSSVRAAIILVGSGRVHDTIESMKAQTVTAWAAASLPAVADPTGFRPEDAVGFLETDGRGFDFVVFALAGTLVKSAALGRFAEAFQRHAHAQAVYADLDITGESGSVWPLAFSAFDYERLLEQGYCCLFFALRRATAERLLQWPLRTFTGCSTPFSTTARRQRPTSFICPGHARLCRHSR